MNSCFPKLNWLLLIPLFIYRLEEVKYNIDPLVELVASLRNKELLYRNAFVRRCHNLHKAELEVLLYRQAGRHIYIYIVRVHPLTCW